MALRGLVTSERLYTSLSKAGYSASLTVMAAVCVAFAPEPDETRLRRFSAATKALSRSFLKPSRSTSALAWPITVILSAGRSCSAFTTLSKPALAASGI